jgi:hypothetical protein
MATRKPYATREQWLVAAINALAPLFKAVGQELPQTRVSVGWPGGGGRKATTIGQCWAPSAAADGVPQMFISPVLGDPVQVLATLVHELVHAIDGCKSGHGAPFARIAKAVGLAGKMTATVAGDELKAKLAAIADRLGEYPHAKLISTSGRKKQAARMILCECDACDYKCRTTRHNLDRLGAPICPGCDQQMRHD